MELISEIIELALDDKGSVSTLLRKCLLLAYRLDNEKLKGWVTQELDGYTSKEGLPDYRIIRTVAKGLFIGPAGASIPDQPLPSYILESKHRDFAEVAYLAQPIASYEAPEHKNEILIIEWPAGLTARYQYKFIQGYALNRAWIELPRSAIVGLVDTVRNRTLRFALEIQRDLGAVSDNINAIPKTQIDKIVTNNIYGSVFIAGEAQHINQIGNLTVNVGDQDALVRALEAAGVQAAQIEELKDAIATDNPHNLSDEPSLGTNTKEWLKSTAVSAAKAGGAIAIDVVKSAVLRYFGL